MKKFKYQEIISSLEADVLSELTVGDLLPSEKELCERYEVSSITVKKALSLLVKENMVKRIPGKGTVFNASGVIEEDSSEPADKMVVLKVLTLNGWATADLLELLCNDFAERNSGVRFEFYRMGNMYFDECSLDNYDLILGNSWMIREYLTDLQYRNHLLPLDELPGVFIDKDILFDEAIKWSSVDEHLFCLPLSITPVVAMYNMDYPKFAEVPLRKCQTFESFCELMNELTMTGATTEDDCYPLLFPLQENRWPCFIKMQGGEIFDAQTQKCTLDLPETVKALEQVSSWLADGIISPTALSWKWAGEELFQKNKIACMYGSFKNVRDNIQRSTNNVEYQMLPTSSETKCSHLLIEGLLVTRRCESLDCVSQLLNYLQTSENQLKICRDADGFSAQKELAKFYLESLRGDIPTVMSLFDQAEYSEPVVSKPQILKWRKLSEMAPKLWMGADSIENVCREITTEING